MSENISNTNNAANTATALEGKAGKEAPAKVTADKPAKPDVSALPSNPNTKWIAAGVGIGIGSAAIAAALLYAGRDRKPK